MSVGHSLIDRRAAIKRDIEAILSNMAKVKVMMKDREKSHADVSVLASQGRQATLKALLADLKKNHEAYMAEMQAILADLRQQLAKLL